MLQYIKLKHLLLFIVAASAFAMVSCKKNSSSGSGAPIIKQIRAISLDSVITAALPGQYVVIQGSNLASTQEVLFDGFPSTINNALFEDNNLVVIVPNIAWDSIPSGKLNTVQVITATGSVVFKFVITPPVPTITSVSNENAVAGTTITLMGSNFYGVTKVTFPGGIAGTSLVLKGTTQITVTVPAGITTGDSLRVTGTYGTGAPRSVFDNYIAPITGFLANFEDGNTYFGWQYWGGIKANDAVIYPNNTGNYIRINPSSSITAGDGSWYGNNRAVMVSAGAWVPTANLADPIGNYALKFEISVKIPWSNGSLMIAPNGNFNYLARYAPWQNTTTGQFVTNGWQTVTIPLTSFLNGTGSYNASGTSAPTIATLTGGTNAATLQIMLYNDSTTPLTAFDAAIDNVRIVKL